MREQYAQGKSLAELAFAFNLSPSRVTDIVMYPHRVGKGSTIRRNGGYRKRSKKEVSVVPTRTRKSTSVQLNYARQWYNIKTKWQQRNQGMLIGFGMNLLAEVLMLIFLRK